MDPNIAGYLSPALSKPNGGAFTHVGGLSFVYPGASLFIREAARDFRAIVIVQYLLGLLAGRLFLLVWNRLADLCPTPRFNRTVHQAIGLFLEISLVHVVDVDRYSQVQFGAPFLVELWILRWLLALSWPRMNRFVS